MSLSERVINTNPSAIGEVLHLAPKIKYNLAVGIPFWTPPKEILDEQSIIDEISSLNFYGPISGNPSLLEKLKKKVETKNKLTNRSIIVTAGANQGFFNICLSLFDPGDEVILFTPYYFNHKMAIQLSNAIAVEVPSNIHDEDNLIDFELLEKKISKKTKAVILVSPSNPTGAVCPQKVMKKLQNFLEKRNIWLISDEAYEDFIFEKDKKHFSPDGPNVINLYSFSKTYGMAGWRCGYIAYPNDPKFISSMAKVQDTIPIVCSRMTQRIAEITLDKLGYDWGISQIHLLNSNRDLIYNTIQKILPSSPKTSGSFYVCVELPKKNSIITNDTHAAYFLAKKFSVLVVPCAGCGLYGYIRIAFGNLPFEKMKEACSALGKGLEALKEKVGEDLSEYYTKD